MKYLSVLFYSVFLLTTNLTKTVVASDSSISLLKAADSGKSSDVTVYVHQCKNLEFAEKIESAALYLAARKNHSNIVEYLLRHGALVDYDELLCWASEKCHVRIAKILLEKCSANANAVCKKGVSPLYLFYSENDFKANGEIVRLLIEHGAKIELYHPDLGININLIEFAISYGDIELVKYLFEKNKIDVNAIYNDGKTLLHYVAECANSDNHEKIIDFLLEQGADTKKKDLHGLTPYESAIFWNNRNRRYFAIIA